MNLSYWKELENLPWLDLIAVNRKTTHGRTRRHITGNPDYPYYLFRGSLTLSGGNSIIPSDAEVKFQ